MDKSVYPSLPSDSMMTAVDGGPRPIEMQPLSPRPNNTTVPGVSVPLGLEQLSQSDSIAVKQKVELCELFTGCESQNRYTVKDSKSGQSMFTAKEETDCCTRQCCGSIRPFNLLIKDLNGREVIHLKRPLACQSCLFPCCLQSIEVFSPPGQLSGSVEQNWSLWVPHFTLKDASGDTKFKIKGPICTRAICCTDVEFRVFAGNLKIGKVAKKWSGCLKEAFTDADNFGITFPKDLDVRMKAVLLGALFLIDFMYFETAGNK